VTDEDRIGHGTGPGYSLAVGACLCCGNTFAFNPVHVPSHPARRGDGGALLPSTDPTDPRAPICRPCIDTINRERKARGMPTWTVHPEAYEPMVGLPDA
jgi:hypothetical protein